jgi:PAS domain S-box-containing protein
MNSEVFRHRILLLIALIGFPAWGFILQAFVPEIMDPMWIRFLFSSLLFFCLLASFKIKHPQKFLQTVVLVGGPVMMIHFLWIAWSTRLPYPIFCGGLILLSGLFSVLPDKRSLCALAFLTTLAGALMPVTEILWIVPPWLVNVSLWTTVLIGLSANFTRLQQLQTLGLIQERTHILFENMQEGLLVLNPEKEVVTCNPAACEIFGLSLQGLTESAVLETLFLSENRAPLPTEEIPFVSARLRDQTIHDKVLGIRRQDGATIWTKMSATPFLAAPGAQEKSILVTFSDISEVKKSHQIIIEQQARLEATAKLTALGEMAAGVSHEINNPLAIILGKVYNIEKYFKTQKSNEPVDVSLAKISQTVERIKKIVKGLQTFATGGEQDPFQPTRLSELVAETVSLCQEKIGEKQIQIQLDIESNLNFDCRPVQISQCLVNLIYNACDAIEHLPDRWIRIWARSAHQTVVLTVTDSGRGIPEEIQKRLMQPFFTTKDPGAGTGLGLSIARGLIHSHLGRIWLDSSSVHTTFVIELPLSQKPQKKSA